MANTDSVAVDRMGQFAHPWWVCALDHPAATLTEERIRQIVREELVHRRDEDGKEAAQLVYDMYFKKPEDEIKAERNHDFFITMAHRLHDRKAPPPE